MPLKPPVTMITLFLRCRSISQVLDRSVSVSCIYAEYFIVPLPGVERGAMHYRPFLRWSMHQHGVVHALTTQSSISPDDT